MPLENFCIKQQSVFLVYEYGYHAVVLEGETLFLSAELILKENIQLQELEALTLEILEFNDAYFLKRSINRENALNIMVYTNDNGYVMIGENKDGNFIIQACKDIPKQELLNIESGFDDMRFIKIFKHLFDLQEKVKVIDL